MSVYGKFRNYMREKKMAMILRCGIDAVVPQKTRPSVLHDPPKFRALNLAHSVGVVNVS